MRAAIAVAVAVALGAGLWLLHESTLYSLYFVTGWLLFAAVGLDLYWRWHRSAKSPQPSRWIGVHAGLAVVAGVLFVVHLEFRIPTGWIESTLALLFLGMLASGLVGLMIRLGLHLGLIDSAIHGPRLAQRWVLVHVPLEVSLITLAVVHGMLVHGHGFMAYVMLGH